MSFMDRVKGVFVRNDEEQKIYEERSRIAEIRAKKERERRAKIDRYRKTADEKRELEEAKASGRYLNKEANIKRKAELRNLKRSLKNYSPRSSSGDFLGSSPVSDMIVGGGGRDTYGDMFGDNAFSDMAFGGSKRRKGNGGGDFLDYIM